MTTTVTKIDSLIQKHETNLPSEGFFFTRFIDEFGSSFNRAKSATNRDSLFLRQKNLSHSKAIQNPSFLPVFCTQVKKFIFNNSNNLTTFENSLASDTTGKTNKETKHSRDASVNAYLLNSTFNTIPLKKNERFARIDTHKTKSLARCNFFKFVIKFFILSSS